MSHQSISFFLRIPLDLRLLIYDEVLERDNIRIGKVEGALLPSEKLQILCVCQQIREECKRIALQKIVFHISLREPIPSRPAYTIYQPVIPEKTVLKEVKRFSKSVEDVRSNFAEYVLCLSLAGLSIYQGFHVNPYGGIVDEIASKFPNLSTIAVRYSMLKGEPSPICMIRIMANLRHIVLFTDDLIYDPFNTHLKFDDDKHINDRIKSQYGLMTHLAFAHIRSALAIDHIKPASVSNWVTCIGVEMTKNSAQARSGSVKHVHVTLCDEKDSAGMPVPAWSNQCPKGDPIKAVPTLAQKYVDNYYRLFPLKVVCESRK